MAKDPVPGAVKTRLCPPLTPEQAAGLYEAFLLDVLASMEEVRGADRFLSVARGGAGPGPWIAAPPGWNLGDQEGDSLGERMVHCFDQLFRAGYSQVFLRNSDSPTMGVPLVEQALRELGAPRVDVVLAPDQGGGYGLVGLRAAHPELFAAEVMQRDDMFAATVETAVREGLQVRLVPACLDVDLPADLVRLRRELARPGAANQCPRTALVLASIQTA